MVLFKDSIGPVAFVFFIGAFAKLHEAHVRNQDKTLRRRRRSYLSMPHARTEMLQVLILV